MRKKLPTIHESAAELQQRLKSETDVKQRQRVHALYLVASGQAQYRKDVASLLGVHRHSVAAWFDAYVVGGLEHMLRSHVSPPPVHRRMTDTAWTALQEKLHDPHGVASYEQIRVWLAEEHQVALAYSSVHALVRYKLRAKPKRPRPSHAKKIQKR
jgi:transposase